MGMSRFPGKRKLCDWRVFVQRGIILIQREEPQRLPAIPLEAQHPPHETTVGHQVPNPRI